MERSIRYHRPGSLAEACELLRSLGSDALPLAGGTDVLVDLRQGSKTPSHLVSLADLDDLRTITVAEGVLKIGALVTPSELEISKEIRSLRPEILDAVGVFGTPQVRNRATVGGNLCTAASCADLAPLLMALNARVLVAVPGGRRELSMEEFFGDHRKTVLEPGHILAEVMVPARTQGEGAAYEAFGLRATNFITVAGVAAYLKMEEGHCAEARLSLGAVAPTPLLVGGAGDLLKGSEVTDEDLDAAAAAAADASSPITDVRGSSEHRRELVERLAHKALSRARERALRKAREPAESETREPAR